jgi:hypothetical protein
MGERFLILEETADALDVIDPELAVQFRAVNGLPRQPREDTATGPSAAELDAPMGTPRRHEIRMDVGDQQIRTDCTCGEWSSAVEWDEIDTMVVEIREHLGSVHAISHDGIAATPSSLSPTVTEKRVG